MSEQEKDEDAERGFVVIDRRGRSDEEGDQGRAEAPPRAAPPPPRTAAHTAPKPPSGPGKGPAHGPLPPLDFASFVHSIAISALHQLGLVADPETGQTPAPDLEMASQNIDILQMLQEKTRGNLDAEEGRLLESLLYELRMRFVEVSGSRPR